MSKLDRALIALIALGAAVILQGWVLAVLWDWFVAPTFGLPHLRLWIAMGIALTVSHLARRSDNSPEAKLSLGDAFIRAFSHAVATPLFTLGLGWIIHLVDLHFG